MMPTTNPSMPSSMPAPHWKWLSPYGDHSPELPPGWHLEYLSHCAPFNAFVFARNQKAADSEGRIQLAHQYSFFDAENARLIKCVQTA